MRRLKDNPRFPEFQEIRSQDGAFNRHSRKAFRARPASRSPNIKANCSSSALCSAKKISVISGSPNNHHCSLCFDVCSAGSCFGLGLSGRAAQGKIHAHTHQGFRCLVHSCECTLPRCYLAGTYAPSRSKRYKFPKVHMWIALRHETPKTRGTSDCV